MGSDADALAGTSWVAQRISNDSGGREALADNKPTIDFGADGRTVSGSTGCNVYSGGVTIGSGTISVAQVAVTERGCIPREIMEQESLFVEILTSADEFTMADGVLELKSTKGSVSFIEPTPVVDVPLECPLALAPIGSADVPLWAVPRLAFSVSGSGMAVKKIGQPRRQPVGSSGSITRPPSPPSATVRISEPSESSTVKMAPGVRL